MKIKDVKLSNILDENQTLDENEKRKTNRILFSIFYDNEKRMRV